MAVAVTDSTGTVAVTMTRAQAEAVLAALLERPYQRGYSEDECVECFLIVQLRAALGAPMPADHWMRRKAQMVG